MTGFFFHNRIRFLLATHTAQILCCWIAEFELVDGVEPIYQHSNADRLSIKSDLGARRKRTATTVTTATSTTTTTTVATTTPRKKKDITAPICITMDNDNDNNKDVLRIRDPSAETKSLEGNGSSNAPSEVSNSAVSICNF